MDTEVQEISPSGVISKKTIDIEAVIRSKNPKLLKFLPRFVLNYFKKVLHEEEMNAELFKLKDKYDFDFASQIIKDWNVTVKIIGLENIPPTGGVVFAANHPLGGFDGLVIFDTMAKVRKDMKFIVNDVLLNLQNLKNLFMPVNKHGKNSVTMLQDIDALYASEQATFIYPAGLVSRKNDRGIIEDLQWKKSFITKAKKHKRNIIPVYLDGRNSNFFYTLSRWRTKLGIKANLEMFYLVDEMYQQKNKTITIIFGKPIPYQTFDTSKTDLKWAATVKKEVYELAKLME